MRLLLLAERYGKALLILGLLAGIALPSLADAMKRVGVVISASPDSMPVSARGAIQAVWLLLPILSRSASLARSQRSFILVISSSCPQFRPLGGTGKSRRKRGRPPTGLAA